MFVDYDIRAHWADYVAKVENVGPHGGFVNGPHFGLDANDPAIGTIVIERPARFYGDSDLPFAIVVDGSPLGKVERFQRVTVGVVAGEHTVSMSLADRYRSPYQTVVVGPQDEVTLRCIGDAKLRNIMRPALHPPIKLHLAAD